MAIRRKSKQQDVYAFIDSQNLNLGIQRMGWKMDWRKFRQYLREKYHVSQAYMFIGYMSENEALYEHLHELGYLIVLKPTVDLGQPHGGEVEVKGVAEKTVPKTSDERSGVKGNIDADLVLYAMKEIPNYSKAIIVSGDGDFFGLIEYLISRNKLAHILTPNWQYSSLLKPFDSHIVRLDQLRHELAYHDRKKR